MTCSGWEEVVQPNKVLFDSILLKFNFFEILTHSKKRLKMFQFEKTAFKRKKMNFERTLFDQTTSSCFTCHENWNCLFFS